MSKIGGMPAFPVDNRDTVCDGMTIRQWYAGMALSAMPFTVDRQIDAGLVARALNAADIMVKLQEQSNAPSR